MLLDTFQGGPGRREPASDEAIRAAAYRLLNDATRRLGGMKVTRGEAAGVLSTLVRTPVDELVRVSCELLTVAESLGLRQDGPDARLIRQARSDRGIGPAPTGFAAS